MASILLRRPPKAFPSDMLKPPMISRMENMGMLGILKLAPITYGGQFHTDLGVHAGRTNSTDSRVISKKPLIQGHYEGPYYRTNGCIRTNEAAMHAIAAGIAKDPLRTLKVQNNGKSPIGKVADSPASRLTP